MESLALLLGNLLSPPVICFGAGMLAIWVKSDLTFPEQVYQALTIYLLLAIGFKGGIAIATTSLSELVLPIMATLVVGSLVPVGVFISVRRIVKLSVADAAALAAHYGSVSAVTFMACFAFLDRHGVSYEKFMPAIMAVMEVPAIFVAMLLAKWFTKDSKMSIGRAIHEVLAGRSLLLLLCGILAGVTAGAQTRELIKPFLITPFYGVLMLFLLEMGLVAGERIRDVRKAGYKLILFAVVAPVVQGIFGLLVGYLIGLSQGGAVVFSLLVASASYIAAPAAVRVSLPEANPGYYVTTSLGITFPFNLVVGIPLMFGISQLIYR